MNLTLTFAEASLVELFIGTQQEKYDERWLIRNRLYSEREALGRLGRRDNLSFTMEVSPEEWRAIYQSVKTSTNDDDSYPRIRTSLLETLSRYELASAVEESLVEQ